MSPAHNAKDLADLVYAYSGAREAEENGNVVSPSAETLWRRLFTMAREIRIVVRKEQRAALRAWFEKEYRRRSAAVRAGTGKIEWLDKGTRVAWSEIAMKAVELGITDDIVTLRKWWDEK